MRGIVKKNGKYLATVTMYTLVITVMSFAQKMMIMDTSWSGFKQSMENFFKNGLAGDGMYGIGIAIAVIGVIAAAISFVVHKFNPQSRMPGWITCLVIAIVGALAMGGFEKPLKLLNKAREILYSWFGL